MASIFDGLQVATPSDFFSIKIPSSPWASVQFRKDANASLDSIEGWEEITINPSNYFDKLTIEDSGGLQKLSMTLVDKEFTRLENIVIRSIATVNNAISQNTHVTTYPKQDLVFKLDKESLINLRVRFGYAEDTIADQNNSRVFIDETDQGSDNYLNRIGTGRTVLRSPWLYFMISGVDFNLMDYGLQIDLKGLSIINTILDQAKVMKMFAVYQNTPKEFFLFIAKIFENVTGKKIEVDGTTDPPLGPKDTKGNLADVTIELGSNAVINPQNPSFMTIRDIINIFCGKISPKVFKASGAVVDQDSTNTDVGMQSSYSYVFKQGKPPENDKLIFYYPDPTRADRQKIIRQYVWREYGRSIVKSFSVSSNTNLAAINAPIPVNDITNSNMSISSAKTKIIEYVKGAPEKIASGFVQEVEDQVQNWIDLAKKPDEFALVSSSIGRSTEQNIKDALRPTAASLVAAINDQVFNGTLAIPGDPFYLFDDRLRPMEYAVKVVLLRPAYIDEQGTYTGNIGDGTLAASYLSGYYLLKKITHTVDINGFNTNLEVMRSPLD